MPFIETDGLKIHYEEAGAGDTTLLLVHGNFASWRWWRPVFERLPAGLRAIAPDLRGCGDTDHPAEGYTIPQLVADLHALVTELGLLSVHLVGHSLGGAVALQFTLDYPDLVNTLTLIGPAPANGLDGLPSNWTSSLFDLQQDSSRDMLQANYRFLRLIEANRLPLRRALQRIAPSLTDLETFQMLVDDAARMAPEAMIGFWQALDSWDVSDRLAEVTCPVLILGGERDALVPVESLHALHEGLSHSKLVIWDDVGHSPQWEQPDRLAAHLFDFVGQTNEVIITPPPVSPLADLQGWFKRQMAGIVGRIKE